MSPEFWTLIGIVVLQLAGMYNNYQNGKSARVLAEAQAKAQEPLTNAQSESAMGDALEKLSQAYDKSLETIRSQNEELSLLRPLTLKIAMQEQATTQTQKDKEDWKRYAEKLALQLEEHEILPLPFRRLPPNGDSQKVKAVTKEQIDAAKGTNEPH